LKIDDRSRFIALAERASLPPHLSVVFRSAREKWAGILSDMNPIAATSSALLAVAVASCSTYAPPATGPTAQLSITGPVTGVYLVENDSCESRRAIPKALWSRLVVPAEKPIALEL
jgi:hypothetical protein